MCCSRNEQALLARPAADATLYAICPDRTPMDVTALRRDGTPAAGMQRGSRYRRVAIDRGARTLLGVDDLAVLPAADERLLAAVSKDARRIATCLDFANDGG